MGISNSKLLVYQRVTNLFWDLWTLSFLLESSSGLHLDGVAEKCHGMVIIPSINIVIWGMVYCCFTHMGLSWWLGVPPVIIHLSGNFHEINHPFLGYPHWWKPPHVWFAVQLRRPFCPSICNCYPLRCSQEHYQQLNCTATAIQVEVIEKTNLNKPKLS